MADNADFLDFARFSLVERPSLCFFNTDCARVMTNCYWNLFKHHIIQLLWKFEEDWTMFHLLMADNDNFLESIFEHGLGQSVYDKLKMAKIDDFQNLVTFFDGRTVVTLIFECGDNHKYLYFASFPLWKYESVGWSVKNFVGKFKIDQRWAQTLSRYYHAAKNVA